MSVQPTSITWELHYPSVEEDWRTAAGAVPPTLALERSLTAFAAALAEELQRRYPQAMVNVYWVMDEPEEAWPNITEIERVYDAVLARGEFYRTI